MYTEIIMGSKYRFTREEISAGNFCYNLFIGSPNGMERRAILLYTLNYKGEDKQEILCELFLRYFGDYIFKSDQVTSKQMIDSYESWYKCGFKDGRFSPT